MTNDRQQLEELSDAVLAYFKQKDVVKEMNKGDVRYTQTQKDDARKKLNTLERIARTLALDVKDPLNNPNQKNLF